MLPRQNVLYENEPKRNVTIRKLTIKNVTDRFTNKWIFILPLLFRVLL